MRAKVEFTNDLDVRELWSALRNGTTVPSDKLRDPDVQSVHFSRFLAVNDGAIASLQDGTTRQPLAQRLWYPNYVAFWFLKGDQISVSNVSGRVRRFKNLSVSISGGPGLAPKLQRPAGHTAESTLLFVEMEKLIHSYGLDIDGLPEHCQDAFRRHPNSRFGLDLVLSSRSWMVIDALRHCKMTEPLRSAYMKAKCEELVCETVDQLNKYRGAGIRKVISQSAREEQLIYAAAQIYQRDLTTAPSVGQLAQRLGINRSKLNDGFREMFGTSPGQYAKGIRLEWAKEQLASGVFAIGEISDLIGYSNPSAFSRAYLEHFGHPPSIDCKSG
jgi:AraC-like DNA-binding protein